MRSPSLLPLLLLLTTLAACAGDLPSIESGGSTSATEGSTSFADDSTGTPAECGNGIVEAGETCDDGGPSATCDEDCTPVDCGDGLINEAAGEQCDEGGQTETCNLDCTLPRCGDGLINLPGELCDDGSESAFCDEDCTPAACGDGLPNTAAGEECDDAGRSDGCNEDCTFAACGDGQVNMAAGEQCDGTELAGATCQSLGYGDGRLSCDRCTYQTGGCAPGAPLLALALAQVKRFDFSWPATMGAEHYELLERAWIGEPYASIVGDIVGESVSLDVPLHARYEASYVLRACNAVGCTDSDPLDVAGSLADAVGYVKASSSGAGDGFGATVALSADGNTLAVGAHHEDSSAAGIDGDEADDSSADSGAVYIFVRTGPGAWAQQAYVKASNTDSGDAFGSSVALSDDGSTLAVGAPLEDGAATGIGGNQASNAVSNSGAVYMFVRDGVGTWSQQAYVKASNTGTSDSFGNSVALSGDGDSLAVGAHVENGGSTGVNGSQADGEVDSGAVYVFVRDEMEAWSQQAYVKASNTGSSDQFGNEVALSGNGDTLAVGAYLENSAANGINGNQADNSAVNAGAVYVFTRDGVGLWSQQAYVKAAVSSTNDYFGRSVALAVDGDTLAVGADGEDGSSTGVGGNQADNSSIDAGATYVFVRNAMGQWSQQAYVKASNTGPGDQFGWDMALADSGDVLTVSAFEEDGSAPGIGGDQADDTSMDAGVAYVFVRDEMGLWSQQAYVKAPNPGAADWFGYTVSVSGDGTTLCIGAIAEDGSGIGIGGDQADDFSPDAGAVYLY